MVPLMLYSRPVPVGAVMLMVPVAVMHVGCAVTLAVAVEGGAGILFTVTWMAVDTHPEAIFLTVISYVPGATPVNRVPAW